MIGTVRRRGAHLIVAAVVAVAGLCGLPGSAATAAEPSPAAQSGVDWLERELEANDYTLPDFSGAPGTTDWGLTIDALIAIAGAGRGGEVSDQVVERITTDGRAYIQWASDQEMGGRAKLAYALLLAGEDPTRFEGGGEPVDLIQTIRDSIQPNGRLGSQTNHFGQTLSILALARTPRGSPGRGGRLRGVPAVSRHVAPELRRSRVRHRG